MRWLVYHHIVVVSLLSVILYCPVIGYIEILLLKCRRILQHSNRVFGAIVTLVVTQVGGKNSVIL